MIRAARHLQALPEGYVLHWYVIETVLGHGGFGITYLARDTNLDQPVAIKEFLPVEVAARAEDSRVHPVSQDQREGYDWGLRRFLEEARTLAQFKHPNIVQVYTVFEANETAYMVMAYERGRSLADALRFRHVEGQAALLAVIEPILDGLERIHEQGFIHRDIKPDNIYLRDDGSPVLLDFGSARQALGRGTGTLTALVSPGFAPFEQYDSAREGESKQGPWTDIYALAATMYCALAGRGPPDAIARANAIMAGEDILVPARELSCDCAPAFLDAIDAGLAFQAQDRPQSISAWRALLRGEPFQDAATALAPTAPPPSTAGPAGEDPPRPEGGAAPGTDATPAAPGTPRPPERSLAFPLVAVALVLLIGIAAWLVLGPAPGPTPPERHGAEAPAAGREPAGAAAQATAAQAAARVAAGRAALEAMRLAAPPGDNALEHFRAALALDPSNAEALAGLEAVADQYLAIAERHLGRADRAMAEEYLDKARGVLPGSTRVAAARARLLGAAPAPGYRPGGGLATSPAPVATGAGRAEAAFRDCEQCPTMVRIAAGSFPMGDDGEAGLPAYVSPARTVTIAEPFAIGRDEITFAEWDACVAERGCAPRPDDSGWGRGERPVIGVSFEHAREYARWLSAKTGHAYRLPSEAEWEYASRGPQGLRFPWGAEEALGKANCWNCLAAGSLETTQAVGSYPPNAAGLRDLAGNVWEWVEDCWNPSFVDAPTDGTAWTSGNCRLRVIKGGSWMNDMSSLSGANRGKLAPSLTRSFVGFRVVREL